MMVTRRRQQPNGAFMPGLQEQEVLGGAPGEAESFWSSFSVVESLFSDDSMGGGVIPFSGGRSIDTSTTSAPTSASGGGGGGDGSRLPFMRQLKSQEAFPPLPPSSSPYIEDNNGYGGNHHHHNGHHGSHRRGGGGGGGGHHQRRGGGGGSGEWITPHTNTNNSSAAPGHHLFPPVNGNTYYNAFNGYNQHFVGVSPAVVGGGSDGFAGDVSRHNGTSPSGSPHNTFSIFSGDYHPSSSSRQQQGGGSSGAIAIGQNAFTAVPDIGASIERHQSMSPFSRSPGGDSVLLSSSPSGGLYSSSPSMNRKRSPAPSLTTTATTIIAPSSSMKAPASSSSLNNKICCDEKALLEEELQSKGLPFSLLLALPNEHLLKIMSYLSGRDLANLQMVGKKRLAVLATDNGLWKELYLRRWKLLEILPEATPPAPSHHHHHNSKKGSSSSSSSSAEESHDEWAWIHSLLQQNERWKDIFQSRHSAEKWRIGTLKMFNGCWGFISQHAPDGSSSSSTNSTNSTSLINANMNNLNAMIASVTVSASGGGGGGGGGLTPTTTGETLDIFFHRKDIAPEGDWYEDWWLKDTPGVSRSQKCGYWDTFLCGRVVRYKQRAAYAQGRRPQACNISFVGDERRERIPSLQYGVGGTLVTPEGMLLPPSMRFAPSPSSSPSSSSPPIPINNTN